jgi:tetratricopeptide (TPR) repeat protein
LGLVYRDRGDFDKAEGYLKKAAEINPGNQTAYCYLGILCELSLKDYQKAEEYFKMMDSRDPERYIKLGWLSVASGANGKTAEIIQELTELNLENTCLYGLLATLYGEMGKYDLAEEYYKKANEARLKYCNSVTRNNYLQLKKILYEKGIKFICVQYPVRSIEPLKKMFAGQQDIVFVDNEKVFKEKLKKGTYKDYFIDFFGGDFGHCTRKGNRLLAENIANVILREVFHK